MTAEALDQAMNKRRLELIPPLRWSQVAQRAGMDSANLRRIRRGDIALTEFAAVGIDRALEWPQGQTWMTYHKDSENTPDLLDDNERKIWSMDAVDEELRRDYIRMYREKKARAAERRETG